MDPNVIFKNILIAMILLGILAGAAIAFQPGSVNTVGTAGGNGGGSFWGGGDHDDDD